MVIEQWKSAVTNSKRAKFLDIGCGSGAISLYMLKQIPEVNVY